MSDKGWKAWLKRPIGYFFAGVLAAAVSVAIYAGAQYFYTYYGAQRTTGGVLDNPASADTKAPPAPGAEQGINQLKRTAESFRYVAKKVGPAVVNIKATKGGRASMHSRHQMRRDDNNNDDQGQDDGGMGGMQQDPFFDFFKHFGSPFPFQPYPQETPQTSFGSGILVDKKGIVVTNNHVVEGANEITITLSGDDKTEMKAKVLGTDPKTDLAVLKIEAHREFPYAEWADSDAVEVGDWAIAIGSPFALGQSVTMGIVSAKGRLAQEITGGGVGETLIQTDAAINPGNSGGPLCDVDGKVMGVNTAIYTRSGGYMGIGFAIPSNLAKDISGKLLANGKIVRGWLGVYIQPLDPDAAKDMGVKGGVSVREVIDDSPAAKAGLHAGDVILEVDGKAVSDVTELQRVISDYKPGQRVRIRAMSYSDRKTRTMTVIIGTLPESEPEQKTSGQTESEPDKLGLVVSKSHGGVTVEMVQQGSIAEQVGFEAGDEITEVNRKQPDSVADYKKLINSSKRLNIKVKRKGRMIFFSFTLPE